MTIVKFDVTGVSTKPPKGWEEATLPFPMEREPKKPRIELPPEYEQFRIYSDDELDSFPPIRWLIKGLLAAGELTCLYGRGGTFKTFIALGWECELAQAGHTVIHILSEGASGMRARVAAWRKLHKVSEFKGNLLVMPSNVNIHEARHVGAWLEAIRLQLESREIPEDRLSLVVVDTVARNFVGGSESLPKDMGNFVHGLETIRRELKTAVLPIHHTDKEGRQERGTLSLRNASFAMGKVTRPGGGEVAQIEFNRVKEAEEPPPYKLRLAKVELPELADPKDDQVPSSLALPSLFDRAGSTEPYESPYEYSADDLKVLKAAGRTNGRTNRRLNRKVVMKLLDCSGTTASEKLKDLESHELLESKGGGRSRFYDLTDKGRGAIEHG